VVNVRSAWSGEYPLMIVSIPKKIVDVMRLEKGEKLRIYTDGERIYLDRFEPPTL
jgi:bifunctional DNA-binding transcriptional regulator/antitoxin component of YhaV-PrlF toxin-antitoxin module